MLWNTFQQHMANIPESMCVCVCVCVSYWFVYWWHCANLHKSTRRHTNLFYGVDSDKIYNLQWAPSLKAGNRNNKRARVPNNAQVGSTNTRTDNRLASVRCPFYLLLFFFSSLQFLLSLLLLLLHCFLPFLCRFVIFMLFLWAMYNFIVLLFNAMSAHRQGQRHERPLIVPYFYSCHIKEIAK